MIATYAEHNTVNPNYSKSTVAVADSGSIVGSTISADLRRDNHTPCLYIGAGALERFATVYCGYC